MRPVKKIEKQIGNITIKTSADVDKAVFDDLVSKMEVNAASDKQAATSTIWRMIMRPNLARYAAIIVVISILLAGLKCFTGSFDGSTVAWAEVVEQLNRYEKYKCRQRVVRQKGPEMPVMNIYHMNLSLRRQECEDGTIHIIDMRGPDAVTMELDPGKKKAYVSKLLGFGPRKDPDIIEMVKGFSMNPDENLGTKTLNGKDLQGFRHTPDKNCEYTVWVDPQTKLPVEIELKHLNRGQTIYMDEFEFDFDMDMSAFSTNVPEGYEVKTRIFDYRSRGPEVVSDQDVLEGLDHAAYALEKLPWMQDVVSVETITPLGTKSTVYITGVKTSEGKTVVFVQGNSYHTDYMVWVHDQKLLCEVQNGARAYLHPNGAIYAELFVECFEKAVPDFTDNNCSFTERNTAVFEMADGVVIGVTASRPLDAEEIGQMIDALVKIENNTD